MKWLDLTPLGMALTYDQQRNLLVATPRSSDIDARLVEVLGAFERENGGYVHPLTWDIVHQLARLPNADVVDVPPVSVGVNDFITGNEIDREFSSGTDNDESNDAVRRIRTASIAALGGAQSLAGRATETVGTPGEGARGDRGADTHRSSQRDGARSGGPPGRSVSGASEKGRGAAAFPGARDSGEAPAAGLRRDSLRVVGAVPASVNATDETAFWIRTIAPLAHLGIPGEGRVYVSLNDVGRHALSVLPSEWKTELSVELAGRPSDADLLTGTSALLDEYGQYANLPNSTSLLVRVIALDEQLDASPWEASRGFHVDEAEVFRGVRSLVPGGYGVFVIPAGLVDRGNVTWRSSLVGAAEVVDLQRISGEWIGDGDSAYDVLLIRRRYRGEQASAESKFLRDAEVVLTANNRQGFSSVKANLLLASGRGMAGVRGEATLDYGADANALEWRVAPTDESLDEYGARFAQAVRADLDRREADQHDKLPLETDIETVHIERPTPDRDLFAEGAEPWPIGFYGTPLPAIEGRLFRSEGRLYEVVAVNDEEVRAQPLKINGRDGVALGMILDVRDAAYHVLRVQLESPTNPEENQKARQGLSECYDRFVERYGPLNRLENYKLFATEPDAGLLGSLEIYDNATETAQKAEIFSEQVIRPEDLKPQKREIGTVADAFHESLNLRGRVDIDLIATLLSWEPDEAATELVQQGLAYPVPGATRDWVTASSYLAGDVKTKLADARHWATRDPLYAHSVRALEEVIPADLPLDEITIQLGAPWISEDLISGFVVHLLGDDHDIEIERSGTTGLWHVRAPEQDADAAREDVRLTTTYGTLRRPLHDLLQRALNQRNVNVYDYLGTNQTVMNVNATIEAHDKLTELEMLFGEYVHASRERAEHVVKVYNDRFNRYAEAQYDGSHLDFPGMNRAISLKDHQRNAVARFVETGRLYLAHEVTTGKTFTMLACMMEAKRLGIADKPAWVVPNHLASQSEREARRLYPLANILTVTSETLALEGREKVYDKIRRGHWDVVILTMSAMTSIEMPRYARLTELTRLEREARDQVAEAGRNRSSRAAAPRAAVRRLERLERERAETETLVRDAKNDWAKLNFDLIAVDEAQNFKNLHYESTASRFQDAVPNSQRARDLYEKVNQLYLRHGEPRGLIKASGTPVSNRLEEMFTIQRFLQPDVLADLGLSSFADWAGAFLKPETRWEPDLAGDGFVARVRTSIHNAPELMTAVRQHMDIVLQAESGLSLPDLKTEIIVTPMTPDQERLTEGLVDRLQALRRVEGATGTPGDNLLRIISDGRKLALHPRLLDSEAEDTAEGRLENIAGNVLHHYEATKELRGTQIIFCDQGVARRGRWSVYSALKKELVKRGIPAKEIAFAQDYKTDRRKAILQKEIRDGVIRVVLSSTVLLGEGTELQDRAIATHHLDAPRRPSDVRQRDYRGCRHGNIFETHHRYIYATAESFDRFDWDQLHRKQTQYCALFQGDRSIRTFTFEIDPSYSETLMIASGNPLLKAKVEIEDKLKKLERQYRTYKKAKLHVEQVKESLEASCGRLGRSIAALQALPQSAVDDRLVWHWDPRVQGIDAEPLSGPSWEIVGSIRRLLRTAGLSVAKGVASGEVAVSLEFEADDMWPHETAIYEQNGEHYEFDSLKNLEGSLLTRDRRLEQAQKELSKLQQRLDAAVREQPKEFEHNSEYQVCKRTSKAIKEMIELKRIPTWTADDRDVNRLLNCVLIREEVERQLAEQRAAAEADGVVAGQTVAMTRQRQRRPSSSL